MKTKPAPTITPVINVGGALPASIAEAREAVYEILASPACDAAKVEALRALNALCAVNATISHNTFDVNMDRK